MMFKQYFEKFIQRIALYNSKTRESLNLELGNTSESIFLPFKEAKDKCIRKNDGIKRLMGSLSLIKSLKKLERSKRKGLKNVHRYFYSIRV